MKKFVDVSGKRYATDPDYEKKIQAKYDLIVENTKIHEYYDMMKSYANKINR